MDDMEDLDLNLTQTTRMFTKAELCLWEPKPEPCGLVIFGASGDLTLRKLIPSLFHLFSRKLLPENFYVLGVARTEMDDEKFRSTLVTALGDSVTQEKEVFSDFIRRFHYHTCDYGDRGGYLAMKKLLAELDGRFGVQGRRVFYLSTPPSLYPIIVRMLGEAELNQPPGDNRPWVRVVVEKPFGTDKPSAQQLNRDFHSVLDECQIYRIDHYLGKETVQNIMMFRFANILFEPAWNRNYIDHVQITASETLGVEHRAGYYEESGVLRDMFQNHLLQLVALIAMEPPSLFSADPIRNNKIEVFKSIRPFTRATIDRDTVRGQYSAGTAGGKSTPAYRAEKGVKGDSTTATYAAMRFEVDNWRWAGVPFYVRSGKCMAERVTEIAIQFKHVPVSIFQPIPAEQLAANVLRFRIQPDEGITMSLEAKYPGPKLCLGTVKMDFNYQKTFSMAQPESYARLLLDSMTGDQTLFSRSDGIEECWQILDPVLNKWKKDGEKGLHFYPAGSWGPGEADTLLSRDDRTWDLPYDSLG